MRFIQYVLDAEFGRGVRNVSDEMRQPDKGPRDKAMKEMLNSLMSFENFQDFRSMMANKATSKQEFVNKHQNSKTLHKGDDESKCGGGQKTNVGNAGKTDDVWACYQCTYINEIRFVTCQMCGALGPKAYPTKVGMLAHGILMKSSTILNGRKKSAGARNFGFLMY